MSILIKGMEVPENCYLCRLGDQGFGIKCRIVGGTYANDSNRPSSRPSWCPLIEVPTPHGRLIDADEFYQQAELTEWDELYMDLDEFKALPTVIEAEK